MKRTNILLGICLLCVMVCGCEERHPSKYYTVEETAEAEWIAPEEKVQPADQNAEELADDKQIEEVTAMAKQLYPENKPKDVVCAGEITVDGYVLTCYQVLDGQKDCYCTICVDQESSVYYLYDEENNMYIPIEYDRNGVRLVG